jgi:hypothetical protein
MKRRQLLLGTSGLAGSALLPLARAAQPCPPPQISVQGGTSATTTCVVSGGGGGTSALSSLAASMSPGSWARLTPANDQNAMLGIGPSSGTMLIYCNSMPWNPVTKCIEIVAMDHNGGQQRHVRYDEASNRFVLIGTVSTGTGTEHGYDHSSVNPYTGDLYHRKFSGFTGTISSVKKVRGSTAFSALPNVAASDQVAIGTCWWSGTFAGAGSQGCFMLFNSGNASGGASDGQILAYDPLSNRWFFNQTGKAPNYASNGSTYHSVIEYSAKKNVAVFGGGDAARRKLWRLNADGSSTPLTNTPGSTQVGVEGGHLVDEPVTGNFLLISAGQLWELNPSGSGTWTQHTGARTPPSAVGTSPSSISPGTICTSIPEYGVVAFITQPSPSGGSFYLYKHA